MNQANPFNSEIPKFRSYLTSIAFERWYTSLKQLRNNISIIYLRITKWNLQQKYTNKFCNSLSFKLSAQGTRMKQKIKKKRRKSWITCVTSPTPMKSIPSRAERHTIWTSRNNCVEKTTNIGKTTKRENNEGDAYRFANVELTKLRSSLKDTDKKNLHMNLSCNNQTTL